jgi:hypothetical protein
MPRVQRICGIRVPIFDEQKLGTGAVTIRFVLEGRIVSKKNNESAIPDAKIAKQYLSDLQKSKGFINMQDALDAIAKVKVRFIGNPEYRACVKRYVPIIKAQMEYWKPLLASHGVSFPLQEAVFNVKIAFKDRRRTDTINKIQTIHDLLVTAEAIRDDDYTVLNPIKGYSEAFPQRLKENVALISLTIENGKVKNEKAEKIK